MVRQAHHERKYENPFALSLSKGDLAKQGTFGAKLEARLKAELVGMETRIRNDMATKADVRAEADRMIEAIQRGTSSNY